MNCRNIVKSYFSILVVFSLTPQPKVFAQSNSKGCEANLYQLSNVAETQTITAADMIDDSDFVEQIGNNRDTTLPTNSPYKSTVNKQVAKYWQIRVRNSDLPLNTSDIKYTLLPSNETDNPFKANKFEPRVSAIEQIETCADETTIIGGGINLKFMEVSNLVPGNYLGEIEVCVQVNGNQCQ